MNTLFHAQFGAVQPSRGDVIHKVAAYNAATSITSPGGEKFDFTRKSGEHDGGELILPPNAPDFAHDPAALWKAAEEAEQRKDGQPARLVEFSIPRTICPEDRLDFARAVVQPWVEEGAAVQLDLHCPKATDGEDQPHAHVILSRRALGPDGFADRKLANEPWTRDRGRHMRGEIAERMNRWLAANGYESRVDHRSNRERGDDTLPEPNVSKRSIEAHKRDPDSPAARPAAEVIAARPKRKELRDVKRDHADAVAEIADLRATHDKIVPGVKSRTRRAGRREVNPAWRPPVGGEITAVSDHRGSLRIDLASGGRIYDRGSHVVAWRAAEPQTAAAVLAEQARRHGWQAVEVTGPPEWRDRIAAALAARGIEASNHTPPPASVEAARRYYAAQRGNAARNRFVMAGGPDSATSNDLKVAKGAAPAAHQIREPKASPLAARTSPATTSKSPPKMTPANHVHRHTLAYIGEQERRAATEYSAGRINADDLQARRLPRAAVAAGDRATIEAAQRGDLEAAIRAAEAWKREQDRKRRMAALTPAPVSTPMPVYRPTWVSGPKKPDQKHRDIHRN